VKLTREERKQAFAGTLNVLRRPKKPAQEPGTKIVLAHSGGGKQVLYPGDDFESKRAREKLLDKGKPLTVDVPKQPSLWLVLKGWHPIKGQSDYQTAVEIKDLREPTRLLSAPPSPPGEAGLKTRWGESVAVDGTVSERKVPEKGAQVENLTPETERGYGGGGRSAVDEAAGVDDATLDDYSRRVAEENELRKRGQHSRADALREESKVAREYRKGNGSGARAAKRRAERAERRMAA
jgi:hypothetical protein